MLETHTYCVRGLACVCLHRLELTEFTAQLERRMFPATETNSSQRHRNAGLRTCAYHGMPAVVAKPIQ